MATVRKTPDRQPDDRLSNLVLEGGRRKKYVTRDAHGRFVVLDGATSASAAPQGEPQPSNGNRRDHKHE